MSLGSIDIKIFQSKVLKVFKNILISIDPRDIKLHYSILWQDQSSSTEAQQSNQPELQITLQEVIGMINSTAHEETRGDDGRRCQTGGDDDRRDATMV